MAEAPAFPSAQRNKSELRRLISVALSSFFSSYYLSAIIVFWIIGFTWISFWQRGTRFNIRYFVRVAAPLGRPGLGLRGRVFDLTEFGAVGDGQTVNTVAFQRAVAEIAKLAGSGGGQLNVPAGIWLTSPFNLTSHMTLFLHEDAVILGLEDDKYWPLMPPLPSYGYGREHPGPRYGSLIHGQNLTDVEITGHNGTIDGQGHTWWRKYCQKVLNYTRGPLIQILWSTNIRISNVTLYNSPFWILHPFDCKNVNISNLTILAPLHDAPNTDGIDPDSCENVIIENCYISVGDDGIAIKSGWDQYGITYNQPSINIHIRNLVIRSMVSAGISIGSEMSGDVSNILVENVHVWNSKRAIRIKTAPGRGGYVRHISYRNLTFDDVRVGIITKTDYNEHPDAHYDPRALPILHNISFIGIHGQNVRVPVRIHGTDEIPVNQVMFRDMSVGCNTRRSTFFSALTLRGEFMAVSSQHHAKILTSMMNMGDWLDAQYHGTKDFKALRGDFNVLDFS